MDQNFNIFDFILTEAEIEEISNLDTKQSLFSDHIKTETAKMFANWKIHE